MPRNFSLCVLRGVKANMPTLTQGELYFATDVFQMWMGTATGNKLVATALPVYDATGNLINFAHIVKGSVTMTGATATVTLSGAAAFTNATSYVTMVSDTALKRTLNVVQNSGTSFTIGGAGSGDVVSYICLGT